MEGARHCIFLARLRHRDSDAIGSDLERFYGQTFDVQPAVGGTCLVGRSLVANETYDHDALTFQGARIAISQNCATITVPSGGPASLYYSRGPHGEAWASHASAAALLARGDLQIDTTAVGEYLAAQFVGGTGTLLTGVDALAPGQEISVTPRETRSSRPDARRWEAVDSEDPVRYTEQAMLRHLALRLRGRPGVWCGLTAGLDSQVAAASMVELGIAVSSFTWAWDEEESDARGASEAARRLGIQHRTLPYDLWDDEAALHEAREVARWSDGAAAVGFGEPSWPEDISAFLTGGGGEVGRAFYWRWFARPWPQPTPRRVREAFTELLNSRLVGARAEVHDRVRRDVDQWVTVAESQGAQGWRSLDAVYADQRMRYWGRAMLPRTAFTLVAAFGDHEVARGLSSLPLDTKLQDGFHRGFLAQRGLIHPQPLLPRRMPRVARRAAWAWRRRRRRLPEVVSSGLASQWAARPVLRQWLADNVLDSGLIHEAMGVRWSTTMRERFLAGDAFAEQMAVWAAGPIALLDAWRTTSKR